MDFDLRSRTILLTVAGSRAYGIHTPESDVDVKGVAIPPKDYYLGYLKQFEQADKASHMATYEDLLSPELRDVVKGSKLEGSVYNLVKFVKLAADANPNILDVLFCRDEEVVLSTPLGKLLRESREMFVSAKAKHTFSGYSASQLRRIKGHRKWLLDPPTHQPTRAEFGLPEQTLIPADHLAAVKAAVQKQVDRWEFDFGTLPKSEIVRIQGDIETFMTEFSANLPEGMEIEDAKWLAAARSVGLDDNLIYVTQKEREYEAARRHWKQFQTWSRSRNEARAALEARFGYDCYLDDTEFLTEHGWFRYDEIKDTDRLATFNQTTGHIEYQHFTERVEKPYTGPMGFLHPKHSDCAVTLNHRMLVSPVRRNRDNNFSTAYDPEAADWTIRPLHSLVDDTRSFFHVRLAGEPVITEYDVTDDYLRLLGAYVSEGCVGKNHADGTPSVLRITQKNEGRLQEVMNSLHKDSSGLEGWAEGEGISICRFSHVHDEDWRTEPCEEIIWTVANVPLASRLAAECGHNSHMKRLPPWTVNLSRRQAEILLDAMCKGDGHQRKHSRTYYTASKRLADDVQALCVHAGIVSQVWGPYHDKRRPESRMYHVYIGEGPNVGHVQFKSENSRNLDIEQVRGRIVCFTVPNEVLVTRRNGKVAIQGNTKHGAHLVRLLRMGREIMATGKVHVWRGGIDAEEILEIRRGAWEYDYMVDWAETEDRALQALYREGKYVVPKQPDRNAIDKLVISLIETALGLGLK